MTFLEGKDGKSKGRSMHFLGGSKGSKKGSSSGSSSALGLLMLGGRLQSLDIMADNARIVRLKRLDRLMHISRDNSRFSFFRRQRVVEDSTEAMKASTSRAGNKITEQQSLLVGRLRKGYYICSVWVGHGLRTHPGSVCWALLTVMHGGSVDQALDHRLPECHPARAQPGVPEGE